VVSDRIEHDLRKLYADGNRFSNSSHCSKVMCRISAFIVGGDLLDVCYVIVRIIVPTAEVDVRCHPARHKPSLDFALGFDF